MFCNRCGAEARTGQRFCAECGAALVDATPDQPTGPIATVDTTLDQPTPDEPTGPIATVDTTLDEPTGPMATVDTTADLPPTQPIELADAFAP
ncbi:MAG: zinc-ribbon domain-containing protein, partial [Ilumatobacteraceae bacterium]